MAQASGALSLERAWRGILGTAIGCLIWVWVRTLVVVMDSTETREVPADGSSAPRVLVFLHGQQMALLGAPRAAETAVLVSHSKDGDIQAAVMRTLGLRVVRGSSTRGGARGLVRLLRLVRAGRDAAIAVDGPRGPASVPKPGAALLAKRTGVALVPVASASRNKIVLGRAWDSFEIPLPFSRVAVVFGAPVLPSSLERAPDGLVAELRSVRARAEHLLVHGCKPARKAAPCRIESR